MSECLTKCREYKVSCPNEECRKWINSEEDLNCVLEAVKNSGKPMTLREIGQKLGITHVAVTYIETNALNKLKSKSISEDF
jgi:DNA-directed RNA polymerase sigma subunit (sigma70/sigma32)